MDKLPADVWKSSLLPFLHLWESHPALAINKTCVAHRSLAPRTNLNEAAAKSISDETPLADIFKIYKTICVATAPDNIEALVVLGTMFADANSMGRRFPALAARALHLALAYGTSDDTDALSCYAFSDVTAACDHARYRLALLYRDGLGVHRSRAIARSHLQTVVTRSRPARSNTDGTAKRFDFERTAWSAARALGELVLYPGDLTTDRASAVERARNTAESIVNLKLCNVRSIDTMETYKGDCHYALGVCFSALAEYSEDATMGLVAAQRFYECCRAARAAHDEACDITVERGWEITFTDCDAAWELGCLYEAGIGVPKSLDGAFLLYAVAHANRDRSKNFVGARLAEHEAWSREKARRSLAEIRLQAILKSEFNAYGVPWEVTNIDADAEFSVGNAASVVFGMLLAHPWRPWNRVFPIALDL